MQTSVIQLCAGIPQTVQTEALTDAGSPERETTIAASTLLHCETTQSGLMAVLDCTYIYVCDCGDGAGWGGGGGLEEGAGVTVVMMDKLCFTQDAGRRK